MAKSVQGFLQDWCNLLVDMVDLSAVQDPAHPDSTIRMYNHGYYTRTITFHECKIPIRITRIIPADHNGPSHALIPWFLAAGRTSYLYDLVDLIKKIRDCHNSETLLHSLALEEAVSQRYLESLRKADLKFRKLLNSDSLDIPALLVTCVLSLKMTWLQTIKFRYGQRIYAGSAL